MRQDMQKVLHETSRSIDSGRPIKYGFVDGESLAPMRESMRRPHLSGWGGKVSHLHLAPLKRFMNSRVGKPWDDVFAEVKRTFTKGNALVDDPLTYVDVAVSTSILDGEVVVHTRWGVHELSRAGCSFYVHPTTRLLCKNDWRKGYADTRRERRESEAAKLQNRRRILDERSQLHWLAGQWYLVQLAELPCVEEVAAAKAAARVAGLSEWTVSPYRFDAVLKRSVSTAWRHELHEKYGKSNLYAVNKRQLNHRELRHYGLVQALAA